MSEKQTDIDTIDEEISQLLNCIKNLWASHLNLSIIALIRPRHDRAYHN